MRSSGWTIRVGGLLLLVGGLLFVGWRYANSGPEDPREMVEQARTLASQGKFVAAEDLARRAISIESDLPVGRRLAAECAIKRQDYQQALQDLSGIDARHQEHWLAAQIMRADLLHHHLYRLRDAEQAYREILKIESQSVFAHDGLARLLGLCGRRQEALPHILSLIRLGEDTDLLILLSREGAHITDPEVLVAARKADPDDANPLIGMAHAAYSNQEYRESLRLLEEAKSLDGLPADYHGRVGEQLLNLGEFDRLEVWAQSTKAPLSAKSWNVLAALANHQQDVNATIRCHWEELKLHPESIPALNQLVQKLNAASHSDLAEHFSARIQDLDKLWQLQQVTIMSSETPQFSDIWELIQTYAKVGRHWEAFAWGKLALDAEPQHQELRQLLNSLFSEMPQWPLEQTLPDYNIALDVDLSHFELPATWDHSTDASDDVQTSSIRLAQNSSDIGFDFTYFTGSEGTTKRMFELAGGGLACLDFDCDGFPDLFCTQGHAWDNKDELHHDALFRNADGKRLMNCADQSGISETGFGQGASAGDLNNDGFPDLYVANTHGNELWINNGDGTFTSKSLAANPQWTTSCLIADVNGDSIADLYDVNYLAGDDLFIRTCRHDSGGKIMCLPYDFQGAKDCLWLGDGEGGFVDRTDEVLTQPPNGKGLGVLAWKPDSGHEFQKGLSLFVSNDTVANFHFTPDDQGTWTDTALSSGLAYNGDGKAEACMGIACGDCDEDGWLDLHVTNFLYESNTFYRNVNGVFLEDRTRAFQLHESSLPVLGFGTQFLDANLDGHIELFVINGHTEDLSKYDVPFEMPPQYFEWMGDQFAELSSEQLGTWYDNKYVGRAVARWDWNVDHKPDLVVGMLDRPSFILTNQSPSENWLEIRLVGTSSARDATGTTVFVKTGVRRSVHQLTAGDGYQCSNQKLLFIGLGQSNEINELTVIWPSGTVMTLTNVQPNQRLLLVEQAPDALVIGP